MGRRTFAIPLLQLLPVLLLAQTIDTSELTLSTTAEALTVRAARIPHGELATTQITQMEIYLNATAKADPLLAVNSLPAATNPDETANVSLRGSPAEATGVYLNGVPLRSAVRIDQSNGVGQFSLFRQVPIRELRVYPSSPPLPFSQASAGVVAIETAFERPTMVQQAVNVNVAGIGYQHTRPVGERGVLRGYVNASDLTAFTALNGDRLEDLRESRAVDGMLSYARRGKGGNGLQLFYLGFDERYVYDYRTDVAADRFEQRKPRHLGVVNYDWSAGDWSYRVNQLLDWEKPRFRWSRQDLTVERTTNHTAFHAERRTPGLTLQYGSAVNNYFDPGDHHYLAEAYAYVQRRTGPWLFGGGVKPVYDGEPAVNVQAAARLQLQDHRIHLSGGSHSQLLGPGRLSPRWQRLRIEQLALEHRFRAGDWTAESAVYAKREAYELEGRVSVIGAESQLTYAAAPWLASVAITSVRSRGELPTRRDIPVAARANLQYNLGGWTAGLSYRGRSGTVLDPLSVEEFERLPYYRRLDASISRTFLVGSGALIVYVNANNLLDTMNVNYYSFRGEEYYSRRVIFFGAVYNW
jgi:hypothetical protein